MQNVHLAVVDDPPARALDPECPVEILAVHEEVVVEQPDRVDDFVSHHHEGTDNRVDVGDRTLVDEREPVSPERPRAWEQPAETHHMVEGGHRTRKTAFAGVIELTVLEMEPRAGRADIGVLGEEIEHLPERPRRHHRVRVQQQQEARPRLERAQMV